MIRTYPKGLKESLAKRKDELLKSIAEKEKKSIELDKSIEEKKELVKEMREFGSKHGLKGKEMAEAFKKYKADKNLKQTNYIGESNEEEKPKRGRPKRSPSPTTITHDFDEKSSKVKKTKKQMLLEAKEEKDKQNREDLAKEANEKQLMFMKKFHPEQYEALMNVKKEEPRETKSPKKELSEIEELEDKINILTEKLKNEKSTTKQNKLMNDREALIVKVKTIEAQPIIKKLIEDLDKALKNGEITKKEYDDMKEGTIKTRGTDHLHIKRLQKENANKQEKYSDRIMKINIALQNYTGSNPKNFNQSLYNEINKLKSEYNIDEAEKKLKELIKEPKKINIKRGNKAKMENEKAIKDRELELEKEHYNVLKTQDKLRIEKDVGEIMKGKSELIKKGKKMSVETELDIKKGLQKKVKNALRKSIIDEIDKKLIGSGLYDSSSDESSCSDDEDNKYTKIINHLLKKIKKNKK